MKKGIQGKVEIRWRDVKYQPNDEVHTLRHEATVLFAALNIKL